MLSRLPVGVLKNACTYTGVRSTVSRSFPVRIQLQNYLCKELTTATIACAVRLHFLWTFVWVSSVFGFSVVEEYGTY